MCVCVSLCMCLRVTCPVRWVRRGKALSLPPCALDAVCLANDEGLTTHERGEREGRKGPRRVKIKLDEVRRLVAESENKKGVRGFDRTHARVSDVVIARSKKNTRTPVVHVVKGTRESEEDRDVAVGRWTRARVE